MIKNNMRIDDIKKKIVPARIDVSKTIDNKVFLDAIKKSKAINYGKDYRKKTDEMNKKLF